MSFLSRSDDGPGSFTPSTEPLPFWQGRHADNASHGYNMFLHVKSSGNYFVRLEQFSSLLDVNLYNYGFKEFTIIKGESKPYVKISIEHCMLDKGVADWVAKEVLSAYCDSNKPTPIPTDLNITYPYAENQRQKATPRAAKPKDPTRAFLESTQAKQIIANTDFDFLDTLVECQISVERGYYAPKSDQRKKLERKRNQSTGSLLEGLF